MRRPWLGPLSFLLPLLASGPAAAVSLALLGTHATGVFDEGAAEIPAYDAATRRIFVVNGSSGEIDILDASGLTTGGPPVAIPKLGALSSLPGLPNSVAVKNGIVAVALENAADKQAPGVVAFYDTAGTFLNQVTVGALPDMLTFSPDGTRVLVANEGEPNTSYTVDPEGSVSIVDISGGVASANVTNVSFAGFNGQEAALRSAGVRIYGPGASAAQDLEPEYIAMSPDGNTAWVTLQEANALATIDVATATVTSLQSLGLKDHSLPGNGLDPSDRDGAGGDPAIGIVNAPVMGMYQPDSLVAFQVNGETYLISANEGDTRDYDAYGEESRVGSGSYVLDPTAFPNAATLKQNANLGRLTVSTATGDTDGDGDFDQIHLPGGRSFSIWNADGDLVFDSGDALEQITAAALGTTGFNANNDDNDSFDSRSDNKGPEPEGLAIGSIDGRIYAFVGLERTSGIVVFDVTDPEAPLFVSFALNRDFSADAESAEAGDLGPEGLVFVAAEDSYLGVPLLIVGNEISGTTSVWAIVPEPGTALLAGLGLAGLAALGRRRAQG